MEIPDERLSPFSLCATSAICSYYWRPTGGIGKSIKKMNSVVYIVCAVTAVSTLHPAAVPHAIATDEERYTVYFSLSPMSCRSGRHS